MAAAGKSPPVGTRSPRRKRAKKGTGEQRLVDGAKLFFAERGFRAPTRELARRLGVSQALIYRYFPNKAALIDRVFESVFIDNWDPAATDRLGDPKVPLVCRLTEFYQAFARRSTPTGVRLFMRANLDDQKLAERYTFALNERILTPIVAALRREAGLAKIARKPLFRAERELAMSLHSAVIFLGIRKHIYHSPLPDDLDAHIALYVETFLGGALPAIARIHQDPPAPPLGARLGGGGRPDE